MKDTLYTALFLLFYLYIGTSMIAVPVFNYKYATEHGFSDWFMFGEMVPTLQSFIWPYYAFKSNSNSETAKVQKGDMQSCYYFLNKTNNGDADLYKLRKEMDEFSKDLSNRKATERIFLKNGAATYIKFQKAYQDDLFHFFVAYYQDSSSHIKLSDSTIAFVSILKEKYFLDAFDSFSVATLVSVEPKLRESLGQHDDTSEINDILKAIPENEAKQMHKLNSVYTDIFNEPCQCY